MFKQLLMSVKSFSMCLCMYLQFSHLVGLFTMEMSKISDQLNVGFFDVGGELVRQSSMFIFRDRWPGLHLWVKGYMAFASLLECALAKRCCSVRCAYAPPLHFIPPLAVNSKRKTREVTKTHHHHVSASPSITSIDHTKPAKQTCPNC